MRRARRWLWRSSRRAKSALMENRSSRRRERSRLRDGRRLQRLRLPLRRHVPHRRLRRHPPRRHHVPRRRPTAAATSTAVRAAAAPTGSRSTCRVPHRLRRRQLHRARPRHRRLLPRPLRRVRRHLHHRRHLHLLHPRRRRRPCPAINGTRRDSSAAFIRAARCGCAVAYTPATASSWRRRAVASHATTTWRGDTTTIRRGNAAAGTSAGTSCRDSAGATDASGGRDSRDNSAERCRPNGAADALRVFRRDHRQAHHRVALPRRRPPYLAGRTRRRRLAARKMRRPRLPPHSGRHRQ